MFQSVNPSISRSKRYQTKTEQKQPGPVVAGCMLWPHLTARTLSVGVTQSLHTAERHAQRDGTGSGYHSAFLYRNPGCKVLTGQRPCHFLVRVQRRQSCVCVGSHAHCEGTRCSKHSAVTQQSSSSTAKQF